MPDQSRHAIVIGINKYQDPEITPLLGARQDAREMHDRLTKYGDFQIANNHFLIDEQATYLSIRKAISDLLWKTKPVDLALLYFSGHGFRDSYGNGYMAPYDMVKGEPMVCGINMNELKRVVLNSINKQCVLVILDCCYSGIPTKDEKAGGDIAASFDMDFNDFQGEGKFIIASSGEDQKSREINLPSENDDPCYHGIFTYHLMQGLDGKAADDTGVITLAKLFDYAGDQLSKNNQKPKCYAADAGQMKQIRIAISSEKHEEFITVTLDRAEDLIKDEYAPTLIGAADELRKVLDVSDNNARAFAMRKKIDSTLVTYRQQVGKWLLENEYDLAQRIRSTLSELDELVPYLEFQKVTGLSNRQKTLLANLCLLSSGKMQLDRFIEKLQPYNSPDRPTTNPTGRSPKLR